MAGASRSAVWIWASVAASGISTTPAAAQRQATFPAISVPAARIDSLVTSRMTTRRIPRVALGIVANGKTVFQQAYGVSNLETETPLTLTSVFELASVTKQFTAASIPRSTAIRDISSLARLSKGHRECGTATSCANASSHRCK